MGYREYEPLSARFKVPIVITGFEPIDILHGVLMTIRQLEEGRAEVENEYSRILDRAGNRPAQALVASVFEIADRKWRGIGTIPKSGYKLRWEFSDHDAEKLFNVKEIDTREPDICISGKSCAASRNRTTVPHSAECDPQHPFGATMVSAEGACAAYYAYGRHLQAEKERDQLVSIGGAA